MSNMFSSCSSLISLNLGDKFDVSNAIMNWMFSGCSSLTEVSVGLIGTFGNNSNVDKLITALESGISGSTWNYDATTGKITKQ